MKSLNEMRNQIKVDLVTLAVANILPTYDDIPAEVFVALAKVMFSDNSLVRQSVYDSKDGELDDTYFIPVPDEVFDRFLTQDFERLVKVDLAFDPDGDIEYADCTMELASHVIDIKENLHKHEWE